jgi:hypothetical protein
MIESDRQSGPIQPLKRIRSITNSSLGGTLGVPLPQSSKESCITLYILDTRRYRAAFLASGSEVNPLLNGTYKPGPKVTMLSDLSFDGIHKLALDAVRKLSPKLQGFPRAYYGLYMDPRNPGLSANILEHSRLRLTDDLAVRGWVVCIGVHENLHLCVELFNPAGGEETDADEPYKTEEDWRRDGWGMESATGQERLELETSVDQTVTAKDPAKPTKKKAKPKTSKIKKAGGGPRTRSRKLVSTFGLNNESQAEARPITIEDDTERPSTYSVSPSSGFRSDYVFCFFSVMA